VVSRVEGREISLCSSGVVVGSGEMSSYINMNTPLAPSDKTSSILVILPISPSYKVRGVYSTSSSLILNHFSPCRR
jgi:hypothetical protein